MNVLIILVSLLSFSVHAQNTEALEPFLTDYCTSYPEGTQAYPDQWKHCCEEHDLYFWGGGSLEDRKQADLRLKACVAETGAALQAQIIYAAVTIGGHSPIRFRTKQWGNAFKNRARYRPLSLIETEHLIKHLEALNSDLAPELYQTFKDQLYSRLEI